LPVNHVLSSPEPFTHGIILSTALLVSFLLLWWNSWGSCLIKRRFIKHTVLKIQSLR
jgi:hypothetical protein